VLGTSATRSQGKWCQSQHRIAAKTASTMVNQAFAEAIRMWSKGRSTKHMVGIMRFQHSTWGVILLTVFILCNCDVSINSNCDVSTNSSIPLEVRPRSLRRLELWRVGTTWITCAGRQLGSTQPPVHYLNRYSRFLLKTKIPLCYVGPEVGRQTYRGCLFFTCHHNVLIRRLPTA
jgi:hypothetical protein